MRCFVPRLIRLSAYLPNHAKYGGFYLIDLFLPPFSHLFDHLACVIPKWAT